MSRAVLEQNKEMSSLLNKANRKAAKLEQQLEKSKVKETKHFYCYSSLFVL